MTNLLSANAFTNFVYKVLKPISEKSGEAYGITVLTAVCLVFLAVVISAVVCGVISERKDRNVILWIVLGLILPFVSIVIISCIPKGKKPLRFGEERVTTFNVMNSVLMVIVIVLCLIPFWMIFTAAIGDNAKLTAYGISLRFQGFSLKGVKYLLDNSNILHSILTTLVTSVSQGVLEMFVCMLAAYAISKEDLVGRGFFNRFLMLTMFFSGGMIPSYIIVRGIGLYDSIWAMILPGVGAAYHILLIKSYFTSLPKSLEEAAYLDGATTSQAFFKVYLPLSLPIVVTVGIMMFIARWNNWMDSLLYVSTKNEKLWTLQYVLRRVINNAASLSGGASGGEIPLISARNAGIMIAVLPLVIISPIMQKYFISGVTAGAVKG